MLETGPAWTPAPQSKREADENDGRGRCEDRTTSDLHSLRNGPDGTNQAVAGDWNLV